MTLKEEMIYSFNYINGNNKYLINEETKIICESIKNNSVSKFLERRSKKIESESLKLKRKNEIKESDNAKELSEIFKEAAKKIRKAETDYKSGVPEAKQEYKKLCNQYSNLLKKESKSAKTFIAIVSAIAGAVILKNIGLTTIANEDIFERIKDGVKGGNLSEVLSSMNFRNEKAFDEISEKISHDGFKGGLEKIKEIKNDSWKDGYHDFRDVLKKPSRIFSYF